jgi:hypothetical protein
MLNDAVFRILRLRQERNAFSQQLNTAGFTPAQKEALSRFLNAFDELARIVVKDEGAIVSKL